MGKEKESREHEQKEEEYVRRMVPSFVAWDILQFFYANPQTNDNLPGIAKNIGRSEADTQQGIQTLVDLGCLEEVEGNEKVYALTQQSTAKKQLDDFMAYCKDPQNRLRIVCKLLDIA